MPAKEYFQVILSPIARERRSAIAAILLLTLLLSGYTPLQAQSNPDSLKKVIATSKDDTNKVNTIFSLVRAIEDRHPEEALQYATEGERIARKIGWHKGIAEMLVRKGFAYRVLGDSNKAISRMKEALQIAERYKLKSTESKAVYNLGSTYYLLEDLKNAIPYFERCVLLDREAGDKKLEADDNTFLAMIYEASGDFPAAIQTYQKSIDVYRTVGDKRGEAVALINIGKIFFDLDDMHRALHYDTLALATVTELKDTLLLIKTWGNMGGAVAILKGPTEALGYYTLAYKAIIGGGYAEELPYIADLLGFEYMKLNLMDSAKHYLFMGLRSAGQQKQKNWEAYASSLIGQYYYRTHNYELALTYLNQSLEIAKQSADVKRLFGAYNILWGVYEAMGKPNEALQAYKQYVTFKDSLYTLDKEKATVRNEIGFEYRMFRLKDSLEHAQQIQLSGLRLQRQRSMLYAGLGLAAAIIVLIVFLQRAKIRRTKTEQKNLYARRLLETELQALRAQMNPHFIFNCLNSIQAFILKENRIDATHYLQKFSKLIRLILDNSQKTSNTLDDETEILRLYMELEQLRLKNKFDYEIDVPEDLESSFTEIPSMVIQPLVENSIWHGLMQSEEKGKLVVSFRKDGNKLTCIVEDNGIGREHAGKIKEEQGKKHESKGMKLIEDRLRAWSETKGSHYVFNIFDNVANNRGTRTEITILYPAYA